MIKIEHTKVVGFDDAIRGMRNPMNSWDKSDSEWLYARGGYCLPWGFVVGDDDLKLMMKLAKTGSVHAKYRRMIAVYTDITAPLYWWKEFDTYKVGTVANSCSTMHKIHEKEFTLDDFSHEHLREAANYHLLDTIEILNLERLEFVGEGAAPEHKGDKEFWWQMIQLLPSSYNQKRTVMLNYEVLAGIYEYRKDHKLDEWRELCKWIEVLPYSQIITGEEVDNNE